MNPFFSYFPTKNLKPNDYLLWGIYFLFLFQLLLTLTYFFQKKKNSYLFLFFLFQFCFIFLFFSFQFFSQKNTNAIFYKSLPGDNSAIRNSIQSFIETASQKNPFILPYDKDSSYIYFTFNFQEILLKTGLTRHYLQIENNIDMIIKDFSYIPFAIIKEDNLYSLMDSPFIPLKIKDTEFITNKPN